MHNILYTLCINAWISIFALLSNTCVHVLRNKIVHLPGYANVCNVSRIISTLTTADGHEGSMDGIISVMQGALWLLSRRERVRDVIRGELPSLIQFASRISEKCSDAGLEESLYAKWWPFEMLSGRVRPRCRTIVWLSHSLFIFYPMLQSRSINYPSVSGKTRHLCHGSP